MQMTLSLNRRTHLFIKDGRLFFKLYKPTKFSDKKDIEVLGDVTIEDAKRIHQWLGDVIAGRQIVGINCANDEPDIVSAAWLADKLTLSKSTIVNRCININIATNGKHLYNREQAIALLTTSTPKRGRRRAS